MPVEPSPEILLERGRFWRVFVNRNRAILGKVVIALNRDAVRVDDLTDEEWFDLRRHMRRVRVALDRLFHPDRFNYAFLMNADRAVRPFRGLAATSRSGATSRPGATYGREPRRLCGRIAVIRDAW